MRIERNFGENPDHFFLSLSELDFNPGPSHNPTDPSLYRFRYEPKYTMRTKTKALSADKGPGPDQKPADLDIYKNRAPRYPMGLKTKELKLDRIPAANAYDTAEGKTKVMIHYPAYSMRSKPGGLSRDKKPGPAEYDLKHHIPFDRMPAFSLRRKHSEYVHVPIVPLDNC